MDKEILIWVAIAIFTAISSRAQAKAKKAREKQQAQPPFEPSGEFPRTPGMTVFGEPIFTSRPDTPTEMSLPETKIPKEIRRQIERNRQSEERQAEKAERNRRQTRVANTVEIASAKSRKALSIAHDSSEAIDSVRPDSEEKNDPQFDLRQAVIYSEILKPRFETDY